MRGITTAMAALAMTAMLTAGQTTEAKADGGAVAIGVGAYLITDAIVGKKCHRRDWPFNIVGKIADELNGRPGCYRHYRHRHYRHHDKHYR
jgi:hypothetical protein